MISTRNKAVLTAFMVLLDQSLAFSKRFSPLMTSSKTKENSLMKNEMFLDSFKANELVLDPCYDDGLGKYNPSAAKR